MSNPRKVLQASIKERKERINHLKDKMDTLVFDLCDTREKLMEAKTELYQFEQAISQISIED